MKKLLTIIGVLSVIATPAFAQSYAHDFGTGNVIDTPALEQANQGASAFAQANRRDAMSSFAQAPQTETRRTSGIDSDSPAATGGGSEGYNWNMDHNY